MVEKSHRWELEYLDAFSEAERSAEGSYENWAPKDRIAHITYWRRRAVEKLAYLSRGQNPPDYPQPEDCNRQTFMENRHKSVQALLLDADKVLEALSLALGRYSEDELRELRGPSSLRHPSLLGYVIDQCYSHPVYHLCDAYLHLDQWNKVDQLQAQRVLDVTGLDPSPFAAATVYYDRASFAALTGDRENALTYLEKCLSGRPDLKQFASQDEDLRSLRDDPRFQALLAS